MARAADTHAPLALVRSSAAGSASHAPMSAPAGTTAACDIEEPPRATRPQGPLRTPLRDIILQHVAAGHSLRLRAPALPTGFAHADVVHAPTQSASVAEQTRMAESLSPSPPLSPLLSDASLHDSDGEQAEPTAGPSVVEPAMDGDQWLQPKHRHTFRPSVRGTIKRTRSPSLPPPASPRGRNTMERTRSPSMPPPTAPLRTAPLAAPAPKRARVGNMRELQPVRRPDTPIPSTHAHAGRPSSAGAALPSVPDAPTLTGPELDSELPALVDIPELVALPDVATSDHASAAMASLPDNGNPATTTASFTPFSEMPQILQAMLNPTREWPAVHLPSFHWLLSNIDPLQLAAWERDRRPMVLVVMWGGSMLDPESPYHGGDIAHIVADYLRVPIASFNISMPIPITTPTTRHVAPWAAAVRGLTLDQRQALLDIQCRSTARGTVFFYPYGTATTHYVCTIGRLPPVPERRVTDMIRRQMMQSPTRNQIVTAARLIPELREYHAEDILEIVSSCIYVKLLDLRAKGGFHTPAYNFYMTPLSSAPEVHEAFCVAFRAMKFADPDLGLAKIHPLRPCTGCHSADHPRGMCPFAELEGWMGEKPRNSN